MSTQSLQIGIVGLPGGWSSEALADRVRDRTGFRLVVDPSKLCAKLQRGEVWCGDHDLCKLDALIIKKMGESYGSEMLDRLELLRFVESRGVRCFSKPGSIMGLLDRLSCTVTLAAAGIPMPATVITEDLDEAVEVVRGFGAAVAKPLYSTKARGMALLTASDDSLAAKLREFRDAGNPVMYLQQKLSLPGKDLGVMFLGGQYIGTYARVKNGGSWNTTIHSGGRYERHEPPQAFIDLAYRAQALFDLDLTSVDVVETDDGPVVFEVSAFGGFSGLRDGCNQDAAALYADYVVAALRGGASE